MTPPEPTEEQRREAEAWLQLHGLPAIAGRWVADLIAAAEARGAAKEREWCVAVCRAQAKCWSTHLAQTACLDCADAIEAGNLVGP